MEATHCNLIAIKVWEKIKNKTQVIWQTVQSSIKLAPNEMKERLKRFARNRPSESRFLRSRTAGFIIDAHQEPEKHKRRDLIISFQNTFN